MKKERHLNPEDRKEACKTYVEQTKLLVALASGFILAPPAAIALLARPGDLTLTQAELVWLLVGESLFVLSVLFGYLTLGSIAGSQDEGTYDVYRTATMALSWLQLGSYILGLAVIVGLVLSWA